MVSQQQRPALGQRIKADKTAHKTRIGLNGGLVKVQWSPLTFSNPVEGIYAGRRFCKNGTGRHMGWDYDGEYTFKCESTVELWLIIPNERTNPIYVFPDDVEVITDGK
ncbi:MAG: hypothetical protein K8L99_15070 [Anaerolineae bacterium]|nr:hypothetical protein [Anaerolineae bacterium]